METPSAPRDSTYNSPPNTAVDNSCFVNQGFSYPPCASSNPPVPPVGTSTPISPSDGTQNFQMANAQMKAPDYSLNYPTMQPPPPAYQGPPPAYSIAQCPQTPMMVYAPPGTYRQQQTTTVVQAGVMGQYPVIVQGMPPMRESYCGHIALACFTFWFCGGLFGLIAFILAVVAENTKISNNFGARSLGRASIALSITGIVIGVIVAIAIGVALGLTSQRCTYYGNYYGYSYRYSCY